MSHLPCRPRPARLSLLLVVMALSSAQAQDRGRLIGIVRDSAGVAVSQVEVRLAALDRTTRTNDSGRFVFDVLPAGDAELVLRRLGYSPITLVVPISASGWTDSVDVELLAHAAHLGVVDIAAEQLSNRTALTGFHLRRAHGLGTYFSREEIEARRSSATTDLLRTVPGVRVVRVGGMRGVRFGASAGRRNCPPMMWLDGQRAPGMELDEVSLQDIEAIEIYVGPSTTPSQFSAFASSSTCGTIVIWTRPPPPSRP